MADTIYYEHLLDFIMCIYLSELLCDMGATVLLVLWPYKDVCFSKSAVHI